MADKARRFAELFWGMSSRTPRGRFGPAIGLVLEADGGTLSMGRVREHGFNEVVVTVKVYLVRS